MLNYRNDGTYDILRGEGGESVVMADWGRGRRGERGWGGRDRTGRGSLSLNVHELVDEGEEDEVVLKEYFNTFVMSLADQIERDEESVTSEDRMLMGRERR
ncbi:hypothetical protein EON65_04580 [archaeon]|nr:MAG: hypothetical protein EON65_04580 [archaeon]